MRQCCSGTIVAWGYHYRSVRRVGIFDALAAVPTVLLLIILTCSVFAVIRAIGLGMSHVVRNSHHCCRYWF